VISAYKALLFVALLAACAPRGELGYIASSDQAEQIETIFVATSRAKEAGGGFGAGRSKTLSYAAFDISIPKTHKTGELEWPSGPVDPATDFAVAEQRNFASSKAFQTQIMRSFANSGAVDESGIREVTVFIHGFNTNYAEGLYRMAQLQFDFDDPSPKILYSWPSAAQVRLYVYDRDSVLFARDGLEELLRMLSNSQVEKIALVAHSMGAQLLMETLRQIYRDGNPLIRAKISSVVLISPDIDVDLFNAQVAQLDPLPQPFVVFATGEDKALKFLSLLAGEPERVGNNMDSSKIENPKILTYDLTSFATGQSLDHFLLASSSALIALLNRLEVEGDVGEALPTF